MKQLSVVDSAYIAGIVDGEGSIGITRHRRSYHHNWRYHPFVNVANTNQELTLWLRDSTRVGAFNHRQRKLGWKDGHDWYLRVTEIPDFLIAILPYLKIKRRQAEIVIEFIKNHSKPGNQHTPLTEQEIENRVNLFLEASMLNEKGRR